MHREVDWEAGQGAAGWIGTECLSLLLAKVWVTLLLVAMTILPFITLCAFGRCRSRS